MNTLRAAIVAQAMGLIDTPYVHQARLPGIGIDCAGVPIVIARALGLVLSTFDITGYPPTPDGVSLIAFCERHMRRTAEPQAGDVPVYRWGVRPQHLGVLVPYRHGGLSLVHALGPGHPAKVIESRVLPNMALVAAYRLPGVPA